MTDDFYSRLSEPCPVNKGDRVEMTGVMANDPAPIEVGTRGTVTGGNAAQIMVKWDTGRSLILLPEDPYRVVIEHCYEAPEWRAGDLTDEECLAKAIAEFGTAEAYAEARRKSLGERVPYTDKIHRMMMTRELSR